VCVYVCVFLSLGVNVSLSLSVWCVSLCMCMSLKDTKRIPANKIINLKIVYDETYLRRLVRAAGGKWNRKKRLWELPYGEAMALGLKDRIVS